jgi:hypothetical protein
LKAWLVTWEYIDNQATYQQKIAAILSPRLPCLKVMKFVEQLYVDSELSYRERIEYVKTKETAYPAEFDEVAGIIDCGHNPFLVARPVKNSKVTTDESGNEVLIWDEIKPYNKIRDN